MNMKRILLSATLLATSTALASGSNETFAASNPKWKTECSACHIAYPARLLPAASWTAVMGGLDKHFGTDASLDASSTTEILAFLQQNASRKKPESTLKPALRITETRWFKHEHDEVPARLWKDPRVKSAANCAACHTTAETGNFNEDHIRLPK